MCMYMYIYIYICIHTHTCNSYLTEALMSNADGKATPLRDRRKPSNLMGTFAFTGSSFIGKKLGEIIPIKGLS